MLGYILLRGKEFSVPDGVSTAIVGLFFGLICGLFYYQHYYKPYYWAFSLGGGLVLTYISYWVFSRWVVAGDDGSSLQLTVVSIVLPFLLTLGLNHGLYLIKHRKRKRRLKRKKHSSFFDTVNPGVPPAAPSDALGTARRIPHK